MRSCDLFASANLLRLLVLRAFTRRFAALLTKADRHQNDDDIKSRSGDFEERLDWGRQFPHPGLGERIVEIYCMLPI
jgi:hypothetical protein